MIEGKGDSNNSWMFANFSLRLIWVPSKVGALITENLLEMRKKTLFNFLCHCDGINFVTGKDFNSSGSYMYSNNNILM